MWIVHKLEKSPFEYLEEYMQKSSRKQESVRSSFQPQHLPQQHLVNSVWNEDHPVGFCWDLYFSAQTKPLQNLQVFSVFVFIVMTLQCSWKVTLTLCLKEKNNKANQPTNQQKQQPWHRSSWSAHSDRASLPEMWYFAITSNSSNELMSPTSQIASAHTAP